MVVAPYRIRKKTDLDGEGQQLGEIIEHTFQFLIEAVLHIINFILCSGMSFQNNDMTPATSYYYV
jgi:hypothetical protein